MRPWRWVAAFAALAGSGCVSAWSLYEHSLYEALRVPGGESYAAHAELLGRIVDESRSAGRKPPPGIYAEYGLYLARTGRAQRAKECFEAEKEAYPESAVFVAVLERVVAGGRAFSGEGGREAPPEVP